MTTEPWPLAIHPGVAAHVDFPEHPRAVVIVCDRVTDGLMLVRLKLWDDSVGGYALVEEESVVVQSGRTDVLEFKVLQIYETHAVCTLWCPATRGRIRKRLPRLRKPRMRLVAS